MAIFHSLIVAGCHDLFNVEALCEDQSGFDQGCQQLAEAEHQHECHEILVEKMMEILRCTTFEARMTNFLFKFG